MRWHFVGYCFCVEVEDVEEGYEEILVEAGSMSISLLALWIPFGTEWFVSHYRARTLRLG